jgi:Fic family protein
MPVLNEHANLTLYQKVKDRNLEQQYILLETAVDVALTISNFRYSSDVMLALHASAANFLDDTPGKFRVDPVHINNSDHTPPESDHIQKYVEEFFQYLNSNPKDYDSFELAAFALWRLTWIHPFSECNGRTARAYAYMVLCIKLGYFLPGEETVLSLMSETKEECYRLLAAADKAHADEETYMLEDLARYLKQLTLIQLDGDLVTVEA